MAEAFTLRPQPRRRRLRLTVGIPLTVLVLALSAWVVALIWLPRTLHYEVSSGRLTVTTGWAVWPSHHWVSLSAIASARHVDLTGGRRIAGTSLPGYCVGRFSFDRLGAVWLAGDCSRHGVVLEFVDEDRPWVLTPADPGPLLEALTGTASHSTDFRFPPASWPWNLVRIGLVLLMATTLVVPAAFLVAPGRLRYRVTPGHLEVDTITGTRRFTLGTCLARPYRPESASKVIGSSLPGYHTGRFTLDGMQSRVYATHFDEGVLIEGPDLRLFITPTEPNAAIEILRSRGGAA